MNGYFVLGLLAFIPIVITAPGETGRGYFLFPSLVESP
jgi:hypothetical protein